MSPRRCVRSGALLLTGVLLLGACSSDGDPDVDPSATAEDTDVDGTDTSTDDDAPTADGTAAEGTDEVDDGTSDADDGDDADDGEEADPDGSAEPPVDPAEVDADELGMVPVLMYHQLREDAGDWDMTADEFRAELEYLFDQGYVPIRTVDLARGEIDVPAGKSPVVLTFDDSTRSQAYLDEDGEFADDTSMGILTDVASQYEDVEPIASIYVITKSLFGGQADDTEILAALHEAGMEIGNHSHTHQILRGLSDTEVQEELATNVAEVRETIPDAEVATLSLPLGIFPDNDDLVAEGEFDGQAYENHGVLLVGYNPAPSPFHGDFDPMAIPRIQTHPDPEFQFGSSWWFEQFEAGESTRRYVSDGDPDTISFPEARADELDPSLEDRANPY